MVDFKKNEIEMKGAWKEVTDDQCSTDWALYGYEGHTNNMALVSKGEDGVDEMMEDLNPSKILYGFLKVDDPKTSLPKYVILNWQGETAPAQMKGKCALHLRDVQRFLPGYHLVVNVRNEDEIDMESIVKKVSEITGSSYNFKQKPQGMEHSPEPVGTAHRKINPMQELPNMAAREKFWTKDQDDEKQRVQDERERRSIEQQKVESERRRREEKERDARDVQVKERERIMAGMKEGEDKAQEREVAKEKSMWEKQQAEDVNEARERSQRAERMRQERATEAKQLIQGASSEARKIFTRNSSQGQMGVAPALKPRTSAVNNIAAKVNGGVVGKSWPPTRSNGDAASSPTPTLKKVMVEAEPSPPPPEFSTTPSLSSVPSPPNSIPAFSHDSNPAPSIKDSQSEIIPAPFIPEERNIQDQVIPAPVIPARVIPAPVIPAPVIPAPVIHEPVAEQKKEVLPAVPDLESPSIAPPPGFQGSDESRDNTVSPDYRKSGQNGKSSPLEQEHRAENKTVSPYKEDNSGQNGIVSPPSDYQQPSKNRSMSPDKHEQNGHQEDLHRAQPVDLDKEPVTLESYGVCAVSLYDYQASDDTEISFDPGQIITHIDQIDPGWWQGLGPDGTYGLFPANYVEIIDSSELQFE